jgi:hypothetical protein
MGAGASAADATDDFARAAAEATAGLFLIFFLAGAIGAS